MTRPEELREQIRGKILAGALPKEYCRMTWFGPGRGGTCAACNQLIGPDDIEVECDLPGGGVLLFHRRCYDLWADIWPSSNG
ncbi:MAG TPA: hypothetical protein VJU81_22620 [Methylomirabilota bacterium]|nr:hypothetical protein [Methylomirabilota bacterium]